MSNLSQSGFRVLAKLTGAGLLLAACLPVESPAAEARSKTSAWEPEITAFQRMDKTNPPPPGAILFVGSSSIRLWKTLAQDFPNHTVINRGFGGSQIADSTSLADRIILPYKPKLILVYAGDNDIAANRTPEQVLADFQALVKKVHDTLPAARLVFISIKPSISRWPLAEKVRAANRLVEEFTRNDVRLGFIDVFTPMLGEDGRPRPELFIEDKLHMNAKGYQLWQKIIAPHLGESSR
jgi:lysophospholipase L1-like esterase